MGVHLSTDLDDPAAVPTLDLFVAEPKLGEGTAALHAAAIGDPV